MRWKEGRSYLDSLEERSQRTDGRTDNRSIDVSQQEFNPFQGFGRLHVIGKKMKMFVIFLVFLNYAPFISNTETHSLMYIYTGLSQGALRLPGAREFTAMGVLDGQVIDYYDSGVEKKVPKQAWMESQMSANYWKQGSLSRRSKQEWFRVNVDILLQRMGHNRSDVHVLQWRHGCRGDLRPDGAVAFRGGVDSYSYDGSDFLSFDHERSEWVAMAAAAQETKRKWDNVPNLKDYTRAYLDKECVTWMSRFLGYRSDRARPPPPPSVVMFAKKTRSESGTALLSCHASGFPFKDVSLEIRRDGRTLLAEDGVASTGVRPNHDWTFQRRDGVEVLLTDRARFTCVLRHPPSGLRVETLWDGEICGRSAVTVATAAGLGATALLVAVSVVVAVLVWRRCKKGKGGARWPRKRPIRRMRNDGDVVVVARKDVNCQLDSLTGSGRISDPSLSSDSGVGSAENGAEHVENLLTAK